MSQAHFSRTFRLKGDNAVKAYRLLDPLGKEHLFYFQKIAPLSAKSLINKANIL